MRLRELRNFFDVADGFLECPWYKAATPFVLVDKSADSRGRRVEEVDFVRVCGILGYSFVSRVPGKAANRLGQERGI